MKVEASYDTMKTLRHKRQKNQRHYLTGRNKFLPKCIINNQDSVHKHQGTI